MTGPQEQLGPGQCVIWHDGQRKVIEGNQTFDEIRQRYPGAFVVRTSPSPMRRNAKQRYAGLKIPLTFRRATE